ncbi:TetR/AcrR family transcriptional regulator C-terminal domain-containing protein [Streptomyces sp. SAS_276]
MLAHRHGAALVVGTYAAEPKTLAFAERLVEALLESGLGDREAAWTSWAVVCFALGLTQEEQAVDHYPLGEALARAISDTTHPALHRVAVHLAPTSSDERFEFGVTVLFAAQGR